jgi:putative intracellular protease/amidase
VGKILCYFFDDMADFEVTLACHMVAFKGNKQLVTFGNTTKHVKSKAGIIYTPECSIEEISSIDEVEALIIPGGWTRILTPELGQLIQKVDKAGKLIASICGGPEFLARAGILQGRQYTTSIVPEFFDGEEDPFPRETFVKGRIVRDGNLITAMPYALVDFAVEIMDWLGLYPTPDKKQKVLEEHTPNR